MLVHGFGANLGHYRNNIPVLAKKYKVYAIDLLGFGASAKPASEEYGVDTWGQLLVDFLAEFCEGQAAVLVGNSVGSLTCLRATTLAPPGSVRGLVLLNSAGALNNKGITDDWRIKAAWPVLMLVDWLLSVKPIATRLFENLRRPESVRNVLTSVYGSKDSVDDELVDLLCAPAHDEGALDVFTSIITGPGGRLVYDILPHVPAELPMMVMWGDQDYFIDGKGPVGQLFQELADSRPNTSFVWLEGVGHCPQDDRPDLVHAHLLPWLEHLHADSSSKAEAAGATTTTPVTTSAPTRELA